MPLDHTQLAAEPEAIAPDGSQVRALRCAPKGAITLWVKVPPGPWSVGPVAGRRLCRVTGKAEALRQRVPWAPERNDGR